MTTDRQEEQDRVNAKKIYKDLNATQSIKKNVQQEILQSPYRKLTLFYLLLHFAQPEHVFSARQKKNNCKKMMKT